MPARGGFRMRLMAGQVRVAVFVLMGLLAMAGKAVATDSLIPVKVTIIKPGKLFKFVAKGTFTLPDSNSDPTANGASLCFQGTSGGQTYTLAAGEWKAIAKGGFKATDAVCKAVLVKANVIKGVCKPDTGTFAVPDAGPVSVV